MSGVGNCSAYGASSADRPETRGAGRAARGERTWKKKQDFAKLLKLVSRLCKNLHFCESRAKRRACCDEQSRAALSDFCGVAMRFAHDIAVHGKPQRSLPEGWRSGAFFLYLIRNNSHEKNAKKMRSFSLG